MQNKVAEQLKQAWQRMNPRQRMIIAGGTLAAVAGLITLTVMMSSTDYKPLMTGLESEDAQAISQQLTAKKVDFKMSPDGREIDVAASQLDAAIIEALERDVPHPNAVRLALERRRDDRQQAPPVALTLPAHVQARDKAVRAHALETYDQLKKVGHEEP